MKRFLSRVALFVLSMAFILSVAPWTADAAVSKKKAVNPKVPAVTAVKVVKSYEDAVRMVRGTSADDPFSLLFSATDIGYSLNRIASIIEPFVKATASINAELNSVLPGLEMMKRVAITEFVVLIGIADDGIPYLRIATRLPEAAKEAATEFEASLGKSGGTKLFEALLGPAGLTASVFLNEIESVPMNETIDVLRVGGADGPVAFVSGEFLFVTSNLEQMKRTLTGERVEMTDVKNRVIFTLNPDKVKSIVGLVKGYDAEFAQSIEETLKMMSGRFIMEWSLSNENINGEKSKLLSLWSNLSNIATGPLKDSLHDISDGQILKGGQETIVRADNPVFDLVFGLGGFKDIVKEYLNDFERTLAPYGVNRGLIEKLLNHHSLGVSVGFDVNNSKNVFNACLSFKGPADDDAVEKLFKLLTGNEKFLQDNNLKADGNGHYRTSLGAIVADFGMTGDKRGFTACVGAEDSETEQSEKCLKNPLSIYGDYFLWGTVNVQRIMENLKRIEAMGSGSHPIWGGVLSEIIRNNEVAQMLNVEPDIKRIDVMQKDVDSLSMRFILR